MASLESDERLGLVIADIPTFSVIQRLLIRGMRINLQMI